jgi:flagellar hook-associated protein 1 FlgK
MSGTGLMAIGTKALTANYLALTTTGHNIANANVAGYSRQSVVLTPAQGQYTGAGYVGKGVDVTTVQRAHDAFLAREAGTTRALAAMDAARLELLQRLEAAFPTGEAGLGYAAGQFLNAMTDLAARPADTATRQVVLARAHDAAQAFATAAGQIGTLQLAVREDLAAQVAEVNGIAQQLAQLNQRIAAAGSLGQPPNDLLDQRDRLLADLSAHLQISTIPGDDGSVAVFVAGGQRLVLGAQAQPLVAVPDPADASRVALGLTESDGVRLLQGAELGGGAIAGLLRFQDTDLVDARTQLGRLAAVLADQANRQQALGLDLGESPGSGAPIFGFGAARVLPNADNAVDGSGAFIGQVALTLTDSTRLVASEYELRADPSGTPGAWQLTRLADGLTRTVASGDVVDGFRVDIGVPPPQAGDRYLLQPVSHAADTMRRVLDDPRGVAAASPVTATAAAANRGTATIAALRVVDPAIDPERSASISFTDDSGAYAWELRDRTTNALLASGTGNWSAGAPIALNGFELSLDGVPRSGDAFAVTRTAYPAANNGNALAFVALRDAALVGRGAAGGGASFTDAHATLLASLGVRVQSAGMAAQTSAAVAQQAQDAKTAQSGVNLDEEAARLMHYQQSYQAAAKILQVAQTVFDTLLENT